MEAVKIGLERLVSKDPDYNSRVVIVISAPAKISLLNWIFAWMVFAVHETYIPWSQVVIIRELVQNFQKKIFTLT